MLGSGNQPPDSTILQPTSDVTIAPGGSVTFSGSGTDPDGNTPLTYRWTFGTGGPATSTSQNPGPVTFPNAGTYVVNFTVTDSLGTADPTPATRTITVQSGSSGLQLIPQSNYSLRFVSSEDHYENGYAVQAYDGNPNTIWRTEWAPWLDEQYPPHEIQLDLGSWYSVNGFRYLPRQTSQSGRIQAYEFYVSTDGNTWGNPVAAGAFADTNSSAARDVLFAPKSGRYVRLRIFSETEGNYWAAVAELSVFKAATVANQAPTATISQPSQNVTISLGAGIRLSGSGNDPDGNLPLTYRWSVSSLSGVIDSSSADAGLVHFTVPGVYTVTFTVADALGAVGTAIRTVTVAGNGVISKAGWTLRYVDSEETVGESAPATNAFDGNPSTFWHTQWFNAQPGMPHEIQIDLGASHAITGFRYLPRQDGRPNGRISQYNFYVSTDGVTWGNAAASGTLQNTAAEQEVDFAAKTGRYVRLQAISEVSGLPFASMAELGVLEQQCVVPSVRLAQPTSLYLQSSQTLQVVADACINAGAGQGIRLSVDGNTQMDIYNPPYGVTAGPLTRAEHVVEAFVIDQNHNLVTGAAAYDKAAPAGIGDLYVAIGDGMTEGGGDADPTNDNSLDGRTTRNAGYPAILSNLLTARLGYPAAVINEGLQGTASPDGLAELPGLLQKYPTAKGFLILYGHNDFLPVPTGPAASGCTPAIPDTPTATRTSSSR